MAGFAAKTSKNATKPKMSIGLIASISMLNPKLGDVVLKKKRQRERSTKAEIDIHSEEPEEGYEPTDAFGEIEFDGLDFSTGQNTSKYVRLHEGTQDRHLLDLLQTDWEFRKPPKLIISVVGGATDLDVDIDKGVRQVFSKGIVEAAGRTDGWIITSGTYGGVVKSIGEAIKDYQQATGTSDIITMGVTAWDILNDKEKLQERKDASKANQAKNDNILGWFRPKNEETKYVRSVRLEHNPDITRTRDHVQLEPNHTHFILVDNKGQRDPGSEIELRVRLEKAISRDWKAHKRNDGRVYHHTPVVYIVINGGPLAIKAVYEAVHNDIPVLVVNKTGRAADILARAFSNPGIPTTLDELKTIMDESRIDDALNHIEACLRKPTYLSVYDEDSSQEMDKAILKALMKATGESNTERQLMLALNMNRVDIAKSEIFDPGRPVKLQDPDGRSEALRYALTHNRHKFVKLILDKVHMTKYLTKEELVALYNTKPPSQSRLRPLLKEITKKDGNYTLEDVGKVIQSLTTDTFKLSDIYVSNRELMNRNANTGAHDPLRRKSSQSARGEEGNIRDLFLFAVLNNFEEMARYIWEEGQENIVAALTACKIYKSMADLKSIDPELRKRLQENAEQYETLAINVLTQCNNNPGSYKTSDLLIRVMPNWGDVTCLSLAESAENLRFLSHPAVQELLRRRWNGKLSDDSLTRSKLIRLKFWLCTFLPVLIPFILTFRKDRGLLRKIQWFYESPRIIFHHNLLFYMAFLILFSYNLIWGEFPNTSITWSQWLLILWVATFFIEEIRQVVQWESKTWWSRLTGWASDFWNILDILTLVLFMIGTCLRFLPLSTEIDPDVARIILAFDVGLYYLRLLEYLTFYKSIGPKVIMIGKMFIDLMFFMCILFVVLLGYGVATHAIQFPYTTGIEPSHVVERIIYKPFFNIFGELFPDELKVSSDDGSCTDVANGTALAEALARGEEPCPEHPRLGTLLLACYLMFSNVLLLNLLIALFSYTFAKIHENTELYWTFQRYSLIKEYVTRPALPPPFIFISHIGRIGLAILIKIHREEYPNRLRKRYNILLTNVVVKWEERQTRLFIITSNRQQKEGLLERITHTGTGIDQISTRMDILEKQVLKLEDLNYKILDAIGDISDRTEGSVNYKIRNAKGTTLRR